MENSRSIVGIATPPTVVSYAVLPRVTNAITQHPTGVQKENTRKTPICVALQEFYHSRPHVLYAPCQTAGIRYIQTPREPRHACRDRTRKSKTGSVEHNTGCTSLESRAQKTASCPHKAPSWLHPRLVLEPRASSIQKYTTSELRSRTTRTNRNNSRAGLLPLGCALHHL